jgi:hypothetical protein
VPKTSSKRREKAISGKGRPTRKRRDGTGHAEALAPSEEDPRWKGKRSALLIANSQYKDPALRKLHSPDEDASSLERILKDKKLGGFGSVSVLRDMPAHIIANNIEAFFSRRDHEEVLLLYFSGHGIRDDEGHLHLAASNTELRLLDSTSVSSTSINRHMRRSLCGRQVLILDCCFGGAFAKGMVAKAPAKVETQEYFRGRGRVILTASDEMQYAFEGSKLHGKTAPSVFTKALVEGIETGEADDDNDGDITIDELFKYAEKKLARSPARQQPLKYDLELSGEIILSRSPINSPRRLPNDYSVLVNNSHSQARLLAIRLLAKLITEDDELAEAARQTLIRLKSDPEIAVADYARRVFSYPEHASTPGDVSNVVAGSMSSATKHESKRTSGSVAIKTNATWVFLNLPFTKSFENLFLAYVCGVTAFGLTPRTILDFTGSQSRLKRIRNSIQQCRYSIHDVSSQPGWNGALELGITIGMKDWAGKHDWFVFDAVRYDTQRNLSDLNETDVLVHDGTVEGVFRALMNVFVKQRRQPTIGDMMARYRRVKRELPKILRSTGTTTVFQSRALASLLLAVQIASDPVSP